MAKSGATILQQQYLLSRDFGGVSYNPPTVWYIGVSTTTINENGTGVLEPTDPSYGRVALDNNTSNWANLISGTGRQNDIVAEFNPATVNQGTITYLGLFDAATGGNVRYYAELVNPKTVGADDVLRIDSGNLQIRLQPTV